MENTRGERGRKPKINFLWSAFDHLFYIGHSLVYCSVGMIIKPGSLFNGFEFYLRGEAEKSRDFINDLKNYFWLIFRTILNWPHQSRKKQLPCTVQKASDLIDQQIRLTYLNIMHRWYRTYLFQCTRYTKIGDGISPVGNTGQKGAQSTCEEV